MRSRLNRILCAVIGHRWDRWISAALSLDATRCTRCGCESTVGDYDEHGRLVWVP